MLVSYILFQEFAVPHLIPIENIPVPRKNLTQAPLLPSEEIKLNMKTMRKGQRGIAKLQATDPTALYHTSPAPWKPSPPN